MNYFEKDNKWICKICNKEYSTRQATTSHIWRQHTEHGRNSPNPPNSKDNPNWKSWNKGLTKETDARVARNADSLAKAVKGRKGKPHTEEAKRKISQAKSINNKGGRAKWYNVSGQSVQGTWERNIALKLNELGIRWVKLKTNKDILQYNMDGKVKSYTPDFYLQDYNVYLEVKGFWWGRDREKMDIVLKTHVDKRIIIVEKEGYNNILNGIIIWN